MRLMLLFIIFILFYQPSLGITPDSSKTSCKRNYIVYDKSISVTILIHKNSFTGFARLFENIPDGFSIDKINCGKGIYKKEKRMLKIVWEDIPSDSLIEITYRLKLNTIESDTFSLLNGTFAAENHKPEQEIINIQNGTITYLKSQVSDPVLSENINQKSDNVSENELQPLSENKETYFCIQVAATGKNVTRNYLKKHFDFDGEFESHYEENIYRITVGKFKSYSEAESALKDYKSKYFKDCFISAYQNSRKISIYEAKRILE